MAIEYIMDQLHDLEQGALVLGAVGFPGPNEVERRHFAIDAWCAQAVSSACDAYPDQADEWRRAFPLYAAMDPAACAKALKTTRRRFRDRALAARMARPYIHEAVTGTPARLPEGLTRPSLDQLAAYVGPQVNLGDAEGIERWIWRPSRPVIHLAIAISEVFRLRGVPDEDAWYGYPIFSGELHRIVAKIAECHEPIVASDRRFGVTSEELIKLRFK
jgi:hypothetical protein